MMKQRLVPNVKRNYLLMLAITISLSSLILVFNLSETHFFVRLFSMWEVVSIVAILFYPYQVLRKICNEAYSFSLPISKKRLLWQEVKPWLMAAPVYLVLLGVLKTVVHMRYPTLFQSPMYYAWNQVGQYAFTTLFGILFLVQAMAVLILSLAHSIHYGLVVSFVIICNIVCIQIGNRFIGIWYQIGLPPSTAFLVYSSFVGLFFIFALRHIEKINQ